MSQLIPLHITPAFENDLRDLASEAGRRPGGPANILLRTTLNALEAMQENKLPLHELDQLSSYPDLSDCYKLYLQTDPNQKPSHRLVWREIDNPDKPGTPMREPIIVGRRHDGIVYQHAGQRLGRPIGVTLNQLRYGAEQLDRPTPAPTPESQLGMA